MAHIGWPGTGPGGTDGPGGATADAPRGHGDARAAMPGTAALAAVRSAVADGARLVDLGVASADAVSAVRAIDSAVIVCADAEGADLTRDPIIAERTGATLLHPGPTDGPLCGAASASRRESLLVMGTPAEVGTLTAIGWAVVVDVDKPEVASTLAVAAVCTWLGARIVRTRHVAAVRQAVEMVESIRGSRAPSWTRRGLA